MDPLIGLAELLVAPTPRAARQRRTPARTPRRPAPSPRTPLGGDAYSPAGAAGHATPTPASAAWRRHLLGAAVGAAGGLVIVGLLRLNGAAAALPGPLEAAVQGANVGLLLGVVLAAAGPRPRAIRRAEALALAVGVGGTAAMFALLLLHGAGLRLLCEAGGRVGTLVGRPPRAATACAPPQGHRFELALALATGVTLAAGTRQLVRQAPPTPRPARRALGFTSP